MRGIDLTCNDTLLSVTEHNTWVLVKFSAPWCEPCQLLDPIFDKLLDQRLDVEAVKVNVGLQSELTRRCGVSSVPTLLLLKQGQVQSQLLGLQTETQINSWLDLYIRSV